MNITAFIDAAVTKAAVDSGISPKILVNQRGMTNVNMFATGAKIIESANVWSKSDESYLLDNIGRKTDHEIGNALGRTAYAVKLRRQRRGMPAHSKRPGWVTGNGAAKILGVDIHNIMILTQRGILPHEIIPGEKGIIAVREAVLIRWAVNPMNWVYFKQNKVTDQRLNRLIQLKSERWHDEWWGTGRVAEYHNTSSNMVAKYILLGKVRAIKWGNWFVLRSEATKPGLRFPVGKGSGHEVDWSEECDAFWILGRAIGLSTNMLDRMSAIEVVRRADFRLRCLWDAGTIDELNQQFQLGVSIDHSRRMVFADWRNYPGRFPGLETAVRKFNSLEVLTNSETFVLRSLFSTWMDWFDIPGIRMIGGNYSSKVKREKLQKMYSWLLAAGLDPCSENR